MSRKKIQELAESKPFAKLGPGKRQECMIHVAWSGLGDSGDDGRGHLVMRGKAVSMRPQSAANRQEALRAFERALEIDPESIDAKIGIAGRLVAGMADGLNSSFEQDAARAEQLLIEALERDPNQSDGHALMGQLRRAQGRWAES